MGIEKECVNEIITSQEFAKRFEYLFSQESPVYKKKLVAGVDYMHPMSGITNKLRAFHEFLMDNREKSKEIVFVQYIVPIKGADGSLLVDNPMFKKLRRELDELNEKINLEFGPDILFVHFKGPSKAERCALWARADILFISCLRDGLCLVMSFINHFVVTAGISCCKVIHWKTRECLSNH